MVLPISVSAIRTVSVSVAQSIMRINTDETPDQFRLHMTYEEGTAARSPI